MTHEKTENYLVAQLDEIDPLRCPCGWTRRAFAEPGSRSPASVHQVDIHEDARTHYHKKLTEIYIILEVDGDGYMELDGKRIPVKPMTSIVIQPGCRHRAVGKMKILNVAIPAFDPADEWFD